MPQMVLISVVFPAPLGPSKAKISPRRMSRSTFLSAWKPEAKTLERFDTEMIACMEVPIDTGARYDTSSDVCIGRLAMIAVCPITSEPKNGGFARCDEVNDVARVEPRSGDARGGITQC